MTGRLVRWPTARQRARLAAQRRVRRARQQVAKGQRPDRLGRALEWSTRYVDSLPSR